MGDQTDQLLRWLRQMMQNRGINPAALAKASGLPRRRVRRVLMGTEPLLVQELLTFADALEIAPEDLGLPTAGEPITEQPTPPPTPVHLLPSDPKAIDHTLFANHPRALIELGFQLACDFLFVASTEGLVDSGIPQAILAQYTGKGLPIRLDAAYHGNNRPRYEPHGLILTLHFDALYDCTFPWDQITQVTFWPEPPAIHEDDDEHQDVTPTLRLVT